MNSADKIVDDGTYVLPGETEPVPAGRLLGMQRTVVDRNGDDWFDSEANDDAAIGFVPLDDEMGAGHLNASRALTQFSTGEYNESSSVDVPVIGWDYGTTIGEDDTNKYRFDQTLQGGSFISIMLAFDRYVEFDAGDLGTPGEYDSGDSFDPYEDGPGDPVADSVINDLDLFLLPRGSFSENQAIASSISIDSTVDHIFFSDSRGWPIRVLGKAT